MKYIKVFETKAECESFSASSDMEKPCILFAVTDKFVSFHKRGQNQEESLPFPIYLETEELDSEFRRRVADDLSIQLVEWYKTNAVPLNSSSYIPPTILSGKIFLDGAEVVKMEYIPKQFPDAILIETEPNLDYNMNEPYKVLQYESSQVPKGTIDIIGN